MAVYQGSSSVTETLTANTIDTVILTKAATKVTVSNVNGSAAIYFAVSHPGGDNPQPSIAGANDFFLSAALTSVDVRHDGQFGSVVQLVSAGSVQYTISILGSGANL